MTFFIIQRMCATNDASTGLFSSTFSFCKRQTTSRWSWCVALCYTWHRLSFILCGQYVQDNMVWTPTHGILRFSDRDLGCWTPHQRISTTNGGGVVLRCVALVTFYWFKCRLWKKRRKNQLNASMWVCILKAAYYRHVLSVLGREMVEERDERDKAGYSGFCERGCGQAGTFFSY